MTSSENSVEEGKGNLDVKRRVREWEKWEELKSGKGDEEKGKKEKEIEGN